MTEPLRVALMGCGRIAQRPAAVLSGQVKQAQLVAVCDIIPDRAKALCMQYNVPCFGSLSDMAKSVHPDAIAVLPPSGDHAYHAMQATSYSAKHIIVEKPLALTLDDIVDVHGYCN